jgi:hypothetical protein
LYFRVNLAACPDSPSIEIDKGRLSENVNRCPGVSGVIVRYDMGTGRMLCVVVNDPAMSDDS